MNMITGVPYNFSFTAASLRPELARIVAECYRAEGGDWADAKERVLTTNALQAGSAVSAVRLEREFRSRLATLSEEQLTILADAPAEDRAAIAWLAAMKRSRFLFDFAAEMLREKLAQRDPVLRPSDYEHFVGMKLPLHPELGRLTPSSREKVRRTLLHMLEEAGILLDRSPKGRSLGTVRRPVLSPAVVQSIVADDRRWLAGFLVPDAEIETL